MVKIIIDEQESITKFVKYCDNLDFPGTPLAIETLTQMIALWYFRCSLDSDCRLRREPAGCQTVL